MNLHYLYFQWGFLQEKIEIWIDVLAVQKLARSTIFSPFLSLLNAKKKNLKFREFVIFQKNELLFKNI